MTEPQIPLLRQGEQLVSTACYVHQSLGNIHVGEVFMVRADVRVRNNGDMIPVQRVKGSKTGHVRICDLRRKM